MRTGTSLVNRIFTFTVFIAILAFIAGSLNLSAKRDYNRSIPPYTAVVMPPSPRPSPSEASSSDAPNVKVGIPYSPGTEPVVTQPPTPAETEPDGTQPPLPAETEPVETVGSEPFTYKFAAQLPEREAVDESYFQNALFIGDSRTVGFCNFTGITKYCYARVALNIKSVLTIAFIEDSSGGTTVTRTILDTVKAYPKSFGKIYISFGINEYSMSGTTFIACYEYFINALRDVLPEGVPIYVQSVLPVNEKAEGPKGYQVKNSQLDAFNKLLADMSQRLGIYFINTAEAVTAKDSFTLPSGIANDGVHLNKSTCDIVHDYLFTHTAAQTTDNKK